MSKALALLLFAISLTAGVCIGHRFSSHDPKVQVLTVMPHHNLTACGNIVSATDASLVLREYDFDQASFVDRVYQVPRSADLGNWESLADAEPDTPVSILYSREDDDTRIAEKIHVPVDIGAHAEEDGFFSFGKVVEVSANTLTIKEYDFTRDADVLNSYKVTPDTEYGNISTLADLEAGDDVVLDYRKIEAASVITTLVKEETLDEESADQPVDH